MKFLKQTMWVLCAVATQSRGLSGATEPAVQPTWKIDTAQVMYRAAASDGNLIFMGSGDGVTAVAAQTGQTVWTRPLAHVGPKPQPRFIDRYAPELSVMGRVIACLRRNEGVANLTLLDAGSGVIRASIEFTDPEWVGAIQAGDYAVCCLRSLKDGETSLKTISLIDGSQQPGVPPIARAGLPSQYLSFGSEAYVDLTHVDVADYRGRVNRPQSGWIGDRKLWFLNEGQRVLSVSREYRAPSPGRADIGWRDAVLCAALWRRTRDGAFRQWAYEFGWATTGAVVANPIVRCDNLVSYLGKSLVFGQGGAYEITDAGAIQRAQGYQKLWVIGGNLYGCDELSGYTGRIEIDRYARDSFHPFARLHLFDRSPKNPVNWVLVLPTKLGVLIGIVAFDDKGTVTRTEYRMYPLPG